MEEKNMGDYGDDGADDFFGDDGEDEEMLEGRSSTMADRELAAVKSRLTTLGYQDGVEVGVEEAVQSGFDGGYAVGAVTGWEVGSLYGGAAAVAAALAQATRLGRNHRGPAVATTAENATLQENTSKSGTEAESAELASISGEAYSSESADVFAPPTDGRLKGGKDYQQQQQQQQQQPPPDEKAVHVAPEAASEDLSKLVAELRHASLLKSDAPRVDRVDIARRLRLVGSAGAAVADSLGV